MPRVLLITSIILVIFLLVGAFIAWLLKEYRTRQDGSYFPIQLDTNNYWLVLESSWYAIDNPRDIDDVNSTAQDFAKTNNLENPSFVFVTGEKRIYGIRIQSLPTSPIPIFNPNSENKDTISRRIK